MNWKISHNTDFSHTQRSGGKCKESNNMIVSSKNMMVIICIIYQILSHLQCELTPYY